MKVPHPSIMIALGVLAVSAAPAAPPTQNDLDRVQKNIEQGEARAKELEQKTQESESAVAALQSELVNLAAAAQARESEILTLDPEIQALETKRNAAKLSLADRLDSLMASLSALERIERRPPAALLARPGEAIDRARSASLLAALVPHLSADAEELKRRVGEIDQLEQSLIIRRTALEKARGDLATTRRTIDAALAKRAAERRNLDAALVAERQRLDKFAREAKDIEGLLAKIDAERTARREEDEPQAPKISAEALAAVSARLPARGQIIRAFGQEDSGGSRADGLTIQAGLGAKVTTPVKGKVAFAGPFKGYGQLLIVSAPGGYHILLAGMARLYADPGQDLKGGEPVGELGETGPAARLYLEVRLHGKPVDPLPFLAAHDGKVSG